MANVAKVSVVLTTEMVATVRQVVDAGEYASASEVMREALREWTHRRAERERAVSELGRQWDAGLASGESVDGEQAFARIHARLDDKLAARSAR
jgi:antitoxin ParD1/3/4